MIVDPDDDKKTQDAEFPRARRLAKSGPRPTTPNIKAESLMPARRSRTTQEALQDGPEWNCTQARMVVVLDRLKTVATALETYDDLQRSLRACNVAANRNFRTAFNGYYRVRQRPREVV